MGDAGMTFVSTVQHLVIDPHHLGDQSSALTRIDDQRAEGNSHLVAAWATESGPLNRVLSLWDVGLAVRRPNREPAQDWLDGRRLTYPVRAMRPLRRELLGSRVCELRMYATKPGRCNEFIDLMLAALPYREQYSPCAGLWTTRERGWDVAVHVWPYPDSGARETARRESSRDPGWANYRTSIEPLLEHLRSWILSPIAVDGA
jgi:hypothetical protein